ncbi:metal-sensing transcriptional repressor [Streptomyces canus]|uniref:metal-sensing transcriptional repressor n=1 Tax=Streptomyces canus TaxID=58343 RepID=UPI00339F5FB2
MWPPWRCRAVRRAGGTGTYLEDLAAALRKHLPEPVPASSTFMHSAVKRRSPPHHVGHGLGQIRDLQRLVQKDQYCIDVLTQVAASSKATSGGGHATAGGPSEHCVREAMVAGGEEAAAAARWAREASVTVSQDPPGRCSQPMGRRSGRRWRARPPGRAWAPYRGGAAFPGAMLVMCVSPGEAGTYGVRISGVIRPGAGRDSGCWAGILGEVVRPGRRVRSRPRRRQHGRPPRRVGWRT